MLGYGADHNRQLSRDLAIQSRGTYTYVDNAEILPVAMGDILSGARAEVFRGARISADEEQWMCLTNMSNGALGGIIPDRDYWVLYKKVPDSIHTDSDKVVLDVYSDRGQETTCHLVNASLTPEESVILVEQVFHGQLAQALVIASNQIESTGTWNRTPLEELLAQLTALAPDQQTRPKLLAVREHAEEMLALSNPSFMDRSLLLRSPRHHHGDPQLHLAARMSSAAAIYSTQRGVRMTFGTAGPVGDPSPVSAYASPLQRGVSTQMHDEYLSSQIQTP